VESYNTAMSLSLLSLVFFVFFQTVTLNTICTEANNSNYDATAEDQLGEQNAVFSELYSEQNFDSCEICKQEFSPSNICWDIQV
jgi:hypothetical protein